MKIVHADFISVINFGGSLKSINTRGVVGDRPGQTPAQIEFDGEYLKITKLVNGKPKTKYVPMTNVSGFEVEEEKPAPVVTKK